MRCAPGVAGGLQRGSKWKMRPGGVTSVRRDHVPVNVSGGNKKGKWRVLSKAWRKIMAPTFWLKQALYMRSYLSVDRLYVMRTAMTCMLTGRN